MRNDGLRRALAIAILGCLATQPARADQRGAKEAFFDPDHPESVVVASPTRESSRRAPHASKPAAPRTIGLRYWIELIGASTTSGTAVTDAHQFHSGERIRLHFQPNADGRVMIVQIGSSGTSAVLFPDATKGVADNLLHANRDQVLPAPTHWFRFDSSAGTEKLLVVFAKTQAAIDELFPTKRVIDAATTAAWLRIAAAARGSKDLMIETETESPDEIGGYFVTISGKPIVFTINLSHE